MPWRKLLTEEMADFLRILSHPHRIRIVHELRHGPLDVNGLQQVLQVSHARVSQYLSALKQHHIVSERREGRHVFYSLCNSDLAVWLGRGMEFLAADVQHQSALESALRESKALWGDDTQPPDGQGPAYTAPLRSKRT